MRRGRIRKSTRTPRFIRAIVFGWKRRPTPLGILYVVAQGSSGNWQVLFPSREVSNGSNLVHRGETRLVPGGNQGQFVFDEQAGTEKLFFVLSRQPEPSLEKLIYSMGGQTAPADPR